MVVQHNLQAMNANRMLGVTTGQQSKSTEKLSSGYKINRAADDAAGLTISEKMRKQIRGLDQASANAQDGISCVQTAEGALTEVHSMLQRMNELAVKAANGTMSTDDRQAVQDEIDQLVTEIDRVSETTKFNEIYLLKGQEGTQKTETTYSYALNAAEKADQKGTLSLIAGQQAYGAGQTTALTGNAAVTTAPTMALDTTALAGNVLCVKTTGAADTTFVQIADADLATYFDVDIDGNVTAKTGFDFVTAGNLTLAQGGGGTAAAGAALTGLVEGTAGVAADTTDIDEYVEIDETGTMKYKDGKMLYTAPADAAAGEFGDQKEATVIKESDLSQYFEVSGNPLTDAAGNKIAEADLKNYFENGAYIGGIFKKDTAGNSTEIGADQIANHIDITPKTLTSAEALEFNLHVGSESADDNKIGVTIESMSASGIGIDTLKGTGLMTEDDATDAINTIADAISKVSKQRSALGAIQNRLEHTISNLDNVVENTTAAESRIRDTDMAEEMVEYSKNNILSQAGQSMLAQANQSTQGVLSLLQ